MYIGSRVALGDDRASIAKHAGHAAMGVTFRIYTHALAVRDGDREHLRAIVNGQSAGAMTSWQSGPSMSNSVTV